MNREDSVHKFYNTEVLDICYETLLEADTWLKEHKYEIANKVFEMLNRFFKNLIDLQENGKKDEIYCIGIQILRTKLLYNESDVLVSAYDKNFYNDKTAFHSYFDLQEIFGFLYKIEKLLLEERAKYIDKINLDDIKTAVQRLVNMYKNYVVQLIRIAIKEIELNENFIKLKKDDEFFIMVGEYKDNLEFVYKTITQRTDKQIKKIIKEIDGKPKGEFYHEMYAGIPLIKLDLRNENFCFSNFKKSNLSYCDCRVGFFIGSDFTDAELVGVSFEHSFLHDAVFRRCNLLGSSFANAIGNLTIPTKEILYSPGFDGVDFRGAKLNHVDFTGANFIGADFREAVFKDTIFNGTNLEYAIFNKEGLNNIKLTQQQLDSITLVSI